MLNETRYRFYIFFVLCGVSFSCASYKPALNQKDLLAGTRIPSIEQTQEGIILSVEEFASADKSKQAFDADVLSSGVLPLLFRIDSKNDANFKVPAGSIRAYLDDQLLTILPGEAAATQAATRDYVGKALGWTVLAGPFAILAWPGTIVGSALHTHHINARIVLHFETLEFKGAVVRSNQPVSGFVYYQIPTDGKALKTIAETKTLQNLRVELVTIADEGGKNVSFNVAVPNIDVSASKK